MAKTTKSVILCESGLCLGVSGSSHPVQTPGFVTFPLHTCGLLKSKLLPKISKRLQGRVIIYLMPEKACVYYSLVTHNQKCLSVHNKLYDHSNTGQTPAVRLAHSCQILFWRFLPPVIPVLYCQLYVHLKEFLKYVLSIIFRYSSWGGVSLHI